ncbi:MAG: SpoIID/LytB domain-containing protein [Coriobacteriia bacterium]
MSMSNQHDTNRILLAALGTLLSLALVLGGPASALAETTFNFTSRGYGHGLGMSQYGAKGFAEHGYSYDYILRYYYGNAGRDANTKVVTWPTAEPTRDVNLDRAANYDSQSSSYNAGYTKTSWTIRPGYAGSRLFVYISPSEIYYAPDGWSTFTAVGNTITWKRPDGSTQVFSGTILVRGESGTPYLTQVMEGTGQYSHTYVRFRGYFKLTASAGKIKLINNVKMNEYLYGVVPRESPSGWHMEALKAQAVTARSYSWNTKRAELYTTTADQVYGGHSRGEDRSKTTPHEASRTNDAVDSTTGQVVTYEGDMVTTNFMSTSGGHTEDNENVWGYPLGDVDDANSHLRGVPDPFELTAGSPAHSWQWKQLTATQVRTALLAQGVSAALVPDPIVSMRVVERGVSGRVMKVAFTSPTGYVTYIEGSTNMDRFKRALGFQYQDRWIYVNPKSVRIAGTDRYDTALKVAQRLGASAGVVIVASGTAPADALAASSLAGATAGAAGSLAYVPVLLTPGNELDSRVQDWIAASGATKVYIVGGTSVVSSAVEAELRKTGTVSVVDRLAGVDRYGTAREIALEVKRLNPSVNRAIVVNGVDFADAVAASSFAFAGKLPIIPVRPNSVPADSAAALKEIGATSTIVIGGTSAVSDQVKNSLPSATRVGDGIDRYESAQLLADYLCGDDEGFNARSVYVSSGISLVDALAVGPLAGYNKNPVVFARAYDLPATTRQVVSGVTSRVWIAGGESVLSGWVEGQMNAACE